VAGLLGDKLIAPLVVDGPMTRAAFLAHLEQCLALSLKRGDTVIFNNLSGHMGVAVLNCFTYRTVRRTLIQPSRRSAKENKSWQPHQHSTLFPDRQLRV
jgi:hypothetical protein